jgi:hypothetical protein
MTARNIPSAHLPRQRPSLHPSQHRRLPATAGLLACALLLGAAPMAQALGDPAPVLAGGTTSPQQIDALVRLIMATLQAGSGHGRAQDLEGRLTFAIDQAQANCSTTQAALIQVQGLSGSLPSVARQALRVVRDALARCQSNGTGTTALRNAQTTLSQGATLSLPGGTSNYQRTQ